MTAMTPTAQTPGPAPSPVRGSPHRRRDPRATATKIWTSYWRPVTLIAAIFVVWWIATALGWVKEYVLPSPVDTWNVALEYSDYLMHHTWVTTYETVIGFAIAIVVGELVAVLMIYSPNFEKTLYPIILVAQVVPKIAIAPLFVVWLGFGPAPKITVAVLMAFFPIVVSGLAGLRSVDPEILELTSTMGAGKLKTFLKVRMPASLPQLLSGLKVAATLAVTGAVVGEFVGGNEGLGYVILQANGNINTPMLFAALFIMSGLGIVLFAIIQLSEQFLIPWHASRRGLGASTTLPSA